MFKEILKLVPTLDQAAMNKMTNTLSTRFMSVAKKFHAGMKNLLTGGGITGVALALVDKILNPIKEVQEAMDRMLKQSDDIVTNAKQFGSSTGELAKLQTIAKSTGLDPNDLNVLITKFQTAIAEAKADPTKDTSVRQFANDTNMVDSFFQFIQGLQKLDKNQQVLVQKEIFGEKQILKMADFLNTNLVSQREKVGGATSQELTSAIDRTGELNDLSDLLRAQREEMDQLTKGRIITEKMVRQIHEAEIEKLKRENKNIDENFENLKNMSIGVERMQGMMQDAISKLTEMVTSMVDINKKVKDFSNNSFFKYFKGWGNK